MTIISRAKFAFMSASELGWAGSLDAFIGAPPSLGRRNMGRRAALSRRAFHRSHPISGALAQRLDCEVLGRSAAG